MQKYAKKHCKLNEGSNIHVTETQQSRFFVGHFKCEPGRIYMNMASIYEYLSNNHIMDNINLYICNAEAHVSCTGTFV